jgi:GNAT superfamily N-acetyltransferase
VSPAVPASFREAAATSLRDVVLRDERDDDVAFLEALYASTRADELAAVPWDGAQKQGFLAHQFALQREQYRQHYGGAEWLLIERDGERCGRLYAKRSSGEVRLMDIALLPTLRGSGLGTRITRTLLDWADALALPVTLHVEPFNPAYRMYRRFGFAWQRSTGVYHFLRREPGARDVDEAATLSRWPRSDPGIGNRE